MRYLFDTFWQAVTLIFSLERDVVDAIFISLYVSLIATAISSLIGVPIGLWLSGKRSFVRSVLITVFNTLHAFPTVVVGLLVYSFICRRGPLGQFDILFTPYAMIVGEAILGLPLAISFSLAAAKALDSAVRETALTLGAGRLAVGLAVVSEARFGIMAAVVATFGRLIGEVGVAMMLGGNIAGYTRNITTMIALETGKGEFAKGIALGIVLVCIALVVNILLRFLQVRRG